MTILLKKFGIECELVSNGSTQRRTSPNNVYFPYKDIEIAEDDEYYSEMVEYKLKATTPTTSSINQFQEFIKTKLDNGFYVNGGNWTGTHIHMFLENNGKPFEIKRNCKMDITHYLMRELYSYFKQNKESITGNIYYLLDLERVVRSHNIWRYFDGERMGNAMRGNMQMFGFDYKQFSSGVDRPKYSPCIWSLPNEVT